MPTMATKKQTKVASSQGGSGETSSESQSLDASQSQDVGVARLQELNNRHQQKVCIESTTRFIYKSIKD